MWSLDDQRLLAVAAFYTILVAVRTHPAIELKPVIFHFLWDVRQAGKIQADAESIETHALLTFETGLLDKIGGGGSEIPAIQGGFRLAQ